MKLIQLKKPLVDLAGEPLKDSTGEMLSFGSAMANIILCNKTDVLRAFTLASDIYKNDSLEINQSDFDFIYSSIKDQGKEMYKSAIVSGQILIMLNDIKKDAGDSKGKNK